MNCPSCAKQLNKKKLENFEIAMCDTCKGMWLDTFTFQEIATHESPFSELLKIDIWEEVTKHKVKPGPGKCPKCEKRLYISEYVDSQIHIDLCPICQGLWFDRGELEKVMAYIEKEIDNETVGHLFNELGEEVKDFLTGQKSLESEVKHVGLIIKLLEYRVFSKFPLLQKLANSIPT